MSFHICGMRGSSVDISTLVYGMQFSSNIIRNVSQRLHPGLKKTMRSVESSLAPGEPSSDAVPVELIFFSPSFFLLTLISFCCDVTAKLRNKSPKRKNLAFIRLWNKG